LAHFAVKKLISCESYKVEKFKIACKLSKPSNYSTF
jgi:hypothetical protein